MDIDVVVLWVDGNDPQWQKEKQKYMSSTINNDSTENTCVDNILYCGEYEVIITSWPPYIEKEEFPNPFKSVNIRPTIYGG